MLVAVLGASGRMGRAVVRLALEQGDTIVCAVGATDVGRDVGDLAGTGALGVRVEREVGAVASSGAEVAIDFSAPAAAIELARAAPAAGVAIVSGTTGLGADAIVALDHAAAAVPVLWEPNMSVGVHVLSEVVRRAVASLPGWDIEIVEAHARAKVAAPSGSALRLAESAQAARGGATHLVHGREGKPGARDAAEIGMHAVRGGDVVGDHAVHLLGGGERLELVHRATSRDVFAPRALPAPRSLLAPPP